MDILDNGSLKIQYNRNRYYDQHTGRWLTHDPLGYVDGMNLYEYIGSNPLFTQDPFGLGVGDAVKGALRLIKAFKHFLYGFGEPWHRDSWSSEVVRTLGYDTLESNLKAKVERIGFGVIKSLECGSTKSGDVHDSFEASSWDKLSLMPLGRFMIYADAHCNFKKDLYIDGCHCEGGLTYECGVDYNVKDMFDLHSTSAMYSAAFLSKLDFPVRTALLFWGKAARKVALEDMGSPHDFMIYIHWKDTLSDSVCP